LCYRLRYASQRERSDQRAMGQANKIAKRLHDKWSGATEDAYDFRRNRRACVGRRTTALRRGTTICRTDGPFALCGASRGSSESLTKQSA
jgi:hypothetical protein